VAFLFIFGLPIALGIVALVPLIKGRREGLAYAAFFFVLTLAVGSWAILRSHSSTAAIGFLLLPFFGAGAGALGWAFAKFRGSEKSILRFTGWACLLGALGVDVALVQQGVETVRLNRSRDLARQAHEQEIQRNRTTIQSLIGRNKGSEAKVLNSMIADRLNDRAFLIPALETPYVSADWLDRLADSKDYGVALTAVRNPNCRPETLIRIYQTHAYPDYFFQALAINANTPPDLLRDLYRRPQTIHGLNIWFAQNPATPQDVLHDIATSNVIHGFFKNPQVDCGLIPVLERALASSSSPDESYSRRRLAELRTTHCRQ
jgi:hypothetical protein